MRDQLVEAEGACSTCRGCACTTFSPHLPGTVDTRKSIDLPSISHADAAVLRQPLLGDIEMAQDLQPRDEAELHPLRQPLHDLQHAVDAEPDGDVMLHRLDVNVARALLDGEPEDRIGQPDDRRVLRRAHQVLLRLGARLGVGRQLQLANEVRLQQVDDGRGVRLGVRRRAAGPPARACRAAAAQSAPASSSAARRSWS